ncbi:hypothetical protein B0H13DRAFT_2288278 [Mycena leptocephala]|nr:hypothetical protein B0H13DRAFT_2288278 [Mycena leptocephala]
MPSNSEPVSSLPPPESVLVEPPSIAAFSDAIRAKKDWYHKILNGTRNLGLKWAAEAHLIDSDSSVNAEVTAALEELKNEARRIKFFDFDIRLEDPATFKEPDLNLVMDSLDSDILASITYAAASPFGVRAPRNLTEEVGIFISDGLVPVSLHRELVSHLDALARREPLDLHPGSQGKVQDLIHPSLYPLVLGESVLDDPSKSEALPPLFSTEVSFGSISTTGMSSRYAWIPSIFNVSEDGMDVHIESDINGLGPREHFPRLYRLIEKVFLLTLPHFQQTLEFEYEHDDSPAVGRWKERWLFRTEFEGKLKRSVWEKYVKDKAAEAAVEKAQIEEDCLKDTEIDQTDRTQFESNTTVDPFSFEGRPLKVIVKAANYQLKPGETYEGTWHMEGMPHERIVASALYYYETDPAIVDQGLNFRKARDHGVDFPPIEEYNREDFDVSFGPEDNESEDLEKNSGENSDGESDCTSDYPSDYSDTEWLERFINLGTVPTTNFNTSTIRETSSTGRILSFPNWIQHQVGKLSVAENTPDDHIAKRKILCFFLVDDDNELEDIEYHGFTFYGLTNQVLTSSDVPFQARMSNFRTLRFLLPFICRRLTGQNLPQELVDNILRSTHWGFSREEAERHRRSLMKDRVIATEAGSSGSGFSLCEH